MENYPSRMSLYGFEYREHDERRLEGPDEASRRPNIKALWQRSHEIINLAAKGFKQTDIAEILCISPQTVSNTLNSELGMKKLSEIRQERDEEAKKSAEKVRVLTNKAMEVYNKIFDNETGEFSGEQQRKTADTVVLELSGLRAPAKIQSHSINTTASLEEIKALTKRGVEEARKCGIIIPADDEVTEDV
jgi:predicted transcriptional regulator